MHGLAPQSMRHLTYDFRHVRQSSQPRIPVTDQTHYQGCDCDICCLSIRFSPHCLYFPSLPFPFLVIHTGLSRSTPLNNKHLIKKNNTPYFLGTPGSPLLTGHVTATIYFTRSIVRQRNGTGLVDCRLRGCGLLCKLGDRSIPCIRGSKI